SSTLLVRTPAPYAIAPSTLRDRTPAPCTLLYTSLVPTRRSFLRALAAASVAPIVRTRAAEPPRVDGRTLRERLEALSVFGRPAGGAFADGVCRVAYSDADVDGRRFVVGLMKAAGLSPRIDPAGNIFGARAGTEAALPPILFGSHIDSVPSG